VPAEEKKGVQKRVWRGRENWPRPRRKIRHGGEKIGLMVFDGSLVRKELQKRGEDG
jgi:hypothetical protein